jgi:hypothetical protein
MKTSDITLIFKELLSLCLNHGLVMDCNNQSIAIIKRKDAKGIYYSINDRIDGVPQKVYHDHCPMTLLLLNADRFKYPVYRTRVSLFQ